MGDLGDIMFYLVQGYKVPPSGWGCFDIPGASQVDKGEHRNSKDVFACALVVPLLLLLLLL